MKKWIAKITGGVEIDVRAAGLFGAINSIIQALRPREEILELKPLTGGR